MPTPPPPAEHQFKPGQTGNPGGLTKELRAQIDANTRMAVAMRQRMLEREMKLMEADPDYVPEVDANTLKLVKDTEDRGLGAPKQETEHKGNVGIGIVEWAILDDAPKATD